jgi:hypothetical protein
MVEVGKTRSGIPYQYKLNNKKRVIDDREGLASNQEEVDDLRAMEKIEEILHAKYERKTRGPRSGIEGRTPIQIIVSVEPTTPCVTNTPEINPTFRQSNFSGRKTSVNTSNQGESTGGASSGSNSQLSTPHEGSSSKQFKIAGHDPTIILQEFQGESSKDPESTYSSVRIYGKKRR